MSSVVPGSNQSSYIVLVVLSLYRIFFSLKYFQLLFPATTPSPNIIDFFEESRSVVECLTLWTLLIDSSWFKWKVLGKNRWYCILFIVSKWYTNVYSDILLPSLFLLPRFYPSPMGNFWFILPILLFVKIISVYIKFLMYPICLYILRLSKLWSIDQPSAFYAIFKGFFPL